MSSSFLKDQVAQFEAYTNSRQPEVRRFVNEYLQGGIIGIDSLRSASARAKRAINRFARIGVNALRKLKPRKGKSKGIIIKESQETAANTEAQTDAVGEDIGVEAEEEEVLTSEPVEDSEMPCMFIFDKDSCQEAVGCRPYSSRCLTEEAYQDSGFMEWRDGPTAKEYKAKYDEYSKLNRKAQEYLDTEATKLEIEEKEYIADKRKEQDELKAQIEQTIKSLSNKYTQYNYPFSVYGIDEMLEKLEESEEEFNNKRREFEDKAHQIEENFLNMAPWRKID